ncbi:hypothetical protein Dsin_007232 [Dipteronia sinensis]|uniref:RNase H type-1 domain-containing protein n=1 Tax=Dipteronia sinensis TaxID=43782 RepID=A0AAE0B137_9ROSI|nr:hypothetical protein Dsin_007232 [Dipteronia sinensis]
MIHNLTEMDLGDVVGWASDYLVKWRLAHQVESPCSAINGVQEPIWRPPVKGSWKIDSYAATCYKNRLIGLFETDSLQVVNMIRNGDHSSADVGSVIIEILAILQSFPSCSICYVPRNGNVAAHKLAHMAE